MTSIYVFLSILTFYFQNAQSCTCANRNDTNKFCESDYVVHLQLLQATIKNETMGKFQTEVIEYKVKIIKIYRENARFKKIEKSQLIYSPSVYSAACGVNLNVSNDVKKTEYLFAGYVAKDKAYVNMCGWATEWSQVPTKLKEALENDSMTEECPDKQVERENKKIRGLKQQIKANLTNVINITDFSLDKSTSKPHHLLKRMISLLI